MDGLLNCSNQNGPLLRTEEVCERSVEHGALSSPAILSIPTAIAPHPAFTAPVDVTTVVPPVVRRSVMLTLIAIAVTVLIAFGMFVWLHERREA
jgi:hypothetical protein